MRGYAFLAIFLMAAGLVMVIAAVRGRAQEFIAAFSAVPTQAKTTEKNR